MITNIFLDNFENENVIISPVSMASQLTLLQEGAGGETKRQLERLGFKMFRNLQQIKS